MTKDQALTEIIRVGAGMANILFNVSQNEALPIDVRESMKDQQRQWDAARSALQSAADTPPPQTHAVGDTITLTPAEAWSLLYNDPKDVRAQTITKMAVWLDGLRFVPATATEGSDNA